MSQRLKTGFLFATPSFFSGLGRTLDLFGTYDEYNSSRTPATADGLAIASDWIIVGQDLSDSIEAFREEVA